jgi:Cu/Ag efflux protein CusF
LLVGNQRQRRPKPVGRSAFNVSYLVFQILSRTLQIGKFGGLNRLASNRSLRPRLFSISRPPLEIERGHDCEFLIIIMKIKALPASLAVCAAVMTLAAFQSSADERTATAAVRQDKNYTGTVISVNPGEHTLAVRGDWLSEKTFNLGDACAYVLWNQQPGAIGNLRPGDKVSVSYQDASGVLVADRVKQQPMSCSGTVKSLDPAAHTLTLNSGWMNQTFQMPDNCRIVLRNDKSGSIADLQAGNHVTVTYETPGGKPTAQQIAQTSTLFTGALMAVDLTDRTVKAKTIFGLKTFHLADNCSIVEHGKVGGKLSDLKLGDDFAFSYNDVNGINIVDRIGAAPQPQMQTTSIRRMVP